MGGPSEGVVRHHNLRAAMADGVMLKLKADAWTPERDGRCPVLVQRLPYGRSVAMVVGLNDTSCRLVTGARRLTTADVNDEVTIGMRLVAWTVAPGERLRMDISAARFPAFDRNPQTIAQPAAPTPRAGCQVATIHLCQLRVQPPIALAGVAVGP